MGPGGGEEAQGEDQEGLDDWDFEENLLDEDDDGEKRRSLRLKNRPDYAGWNIG